ncbi:MAG: hypothetical protein HQL03_10740 [Nitrospirae bacterium]|nr:hypothetical protein [Nitrospirota bacterium]
MMRAFWDIVKDILVHNEAIIEDYGECMEALVTREVAQTLEIPEFSHLCRSQTSDSDDTVQLSYDSELFGRLARLFKGSGQFSQMTISPRPLRYEKIIATLPEKITFSNAVFKLNDTEEKTVSYMLLFFRYTAISDEKKDGIISLLVNETNLSIAVLDRNSEDKYSGSDILRELVTRQSIEQLNTIDKMDTSLAIQAAHKAVKAVIMAELKGFISSLNRRLNRNIERVVDYYETMLSETEQRAIKKGIAGDDKTADKIKAIKTELKWKTQDLITNFALNIRTELLSATRILSPTSVFKITIQRRKSVREFLLTYNQILRRIDSLPCEHCFFPEKPYFVCDDKLHIICRNCYIECKKCERHYCSACYPDGCPKCGSELKGSG